MFIRYVDREMFVTNQALLVHLFSHCKLQCVQADGGKNWNSLYLRVKGDQ